MHWACNGYRRHSATVTKIFCGVLISISSNCQGGRTDAHFGSAGAVMTPLLYKDFLPKKNNGIMGDWCDPKQWFT
jgi:hypothetical protein